MKEQTYGWYPSVRDVYLSKNQPTPYHLECLYKFRESGYHNPIVDPPEPAFIIRGISPAPPTPPSRPMTSRPMTSRSRGRGPSRPKSVPVPKFRPVPKMGPVPTPMQAWRESLAETSWGVTSPRTPQDPPANDKQPADHSPVQLTWPAQQMAGKYDKPFQPAASRETVEEQVFGTPLPPKDPGSGGDSGYVFVPTGDGGVEVHSPPLYWPDSHPRTPTPQHSASSRASYGGSSEGYAARRQAQEEAQQQARKDREDKQRNAERHRRFEKIVRQQEQARGSSQPPQVSQRSASPCAKSASVRERVKSAKTYRPKTSVPHRPVYSARPSRPCPHAFENDDAAPRDTAVTPRPPNTLPPAPSLEDVCVDEDRSPSPDTYQEAIDRYGWRAQVHGDPFNIKKVAKRLPYTVKCVEPVLAPEPPHVHMESKETFFINTIPRRKATFDVHQDWLSEGLHAQRIELQKREGIKYRYKTFSFAY